MRNIYKYLKRYSYITSISTAFLITFSCLFAEFINNNKYQLVSISAIQFDILLRLGSNFGVSALKSRKPLKI